MKDSINYWSLQRMCYFLIINILLHIHTRGLNLVDSNDRDYNSIKMASIVQ